MGRVRGAMPSFTGKKKLSKNEPQEDQDGDACKVICVITSLRKGTLLTTVGQLLPQACLEIEQSRLVCSFEQGDRLNGYLEKVTHHCSGGPEDHRGRILQDQTEASDGDSKTKRMDRTALGYSVRVGCQVKFT